MIKAIKTLLNENHSIYPNPKGRLNDFQTFLPLGQG